MQQSSKKLLNGCYQKIQFLGRGSYGSVYLYQKVSQRKRNIFTDFFYGKNQHIGQYFALKKYHPQLSKDRQGINFSALREINLLISMKHKNIASCYQVIHKKSAKGGQLQSCNHQVYVVLDFYLQLKQILTIPSIVKNDYDRKLICYQILQGIAFLHKNYIIHRDLKPQNIFISRNGQIKISDFGFAKQFGSPHGKYTANTCTKQYRAPQLFFGTHYYTQKTDIWSFGCIIAYIFKNKTIFLSQSQTDLQVLGRIFRLRGTPNIKNWPHFDKFPDFLNFQDTQQKNLQKELELTPDVAKIIDHCLQLNPVRRPSAEQLLRHQFFKEVRTYNLKMQQFFDQKLKQIVGKSSKAINNFQQDI